MLNKILLASKGRLIKTLYSINRVRIGSIRQAAENYDMVKEKNEIFYSRLYLHFINKRIEELFADSKLEILDAGCGQGRLAVPLAKNGHKITAMDLSAKVIGRAMKYANEENAGVDYITGDFRNEIKIMDPGSFDCVISTEVLYMLSDYRKVIGNFVRLLKPGGLLIISFRPRLFYVRWLILNNRIAEAADLLLNQRSSVDSGQLNCQSKEEMVVIFHNQGLINVETRGLGILSGIAGDPQANYVMPEQLDGKSLELLFNMEISLSEKQCESSRYILVSGIKK